MLVTALTFISLIPLYLFLSFSVIRQRRKRQIAYGSGEDVELLKRIGAHSNFSQYVPLVLIGMLITEAMGASELRLLIPAVFIVLGRHLHAFGLLQKKENFRFRVSGMILTFASLISISVSLFVEVLDIWI